MARQSVHIGGESFDSIKLACERAQSIMRAAEIEEPLCGRDGAFVAAMLLSRASKLALTTMPPVVWVGHNDYGTRTFFFLCKDGRSLDFSYRSAIREAAGVLDQRATILERYKKAMRTAVVDDTQAAKAAVLALPDPRCALCGCGLDASLAHADHPYPATFDHILYEFTKRAKLRVSAVKVEDVGVGRWELEDPRLAEKWRGFHSQYAQIRVVCAPCNLGQIRTASRDWMGLL